AAALFADDEQESRARLAFGAEAFDRRDLRGEDPFRVAGAAAVEPVAFDPARKKRRHAIEVRRQHHVGRRGRGEDVEARVVHRLGDDRVAEAAQKAGQPAAGLALAAGRRIDVDERARDGYRIHASSSVRVSVLESRYLTM